MARHVQMYYLPHSGQEPTALAAKNGIVMSEAKTDAIAGELNGTFPVGIGYKFSRQRSVNTAMQNRLTLPDRYLNVESRQVDTPNTCSGECTDAFVFMRVQATWVGLVRPIYETTASTNHRTGVNTVMSRRIVRWEHELGIKALRTAGWTTAYTPLDFRNFTGEPGTPVWNMVSAFQGQIKDELTGNLTITGTAVDYIRAFPNQIPMSPAHAWETQTWEWSNPDYPALFQNNGGQHLRGLR